MEDGEVSEPEVPNLFGLVGLKRRGVQFFRIDLQGLFWVDPGLKIRVWGGLSLLSRLWVQR